MHIGQVDLAKVFLSYTKYLQVTCDRVKIVTRYLRDKPVRFRINPILTKGVQPTEWISSQVDEVVMHGNKVLSSIVDQLAAS